MSTTAFALVLGLWLLMPFIVVNVVAQDALPYGAAGRLLRSDPHEIYAIRDNDVQTVSPGFQKMYCEIADLRGDDCDTFAVAYIATPLALPFAAVLAKMPWRTASLFMRLLAAGALVAGMWLIWKRLAHRTPLAAPILVVTAILLTPMAAVPIGYGQTSPLLFLSVCLGMGTTGNRRRLAGALSWVAGIVFKAFPAVLIVVALARRKWRFLATAAVALAIVAIATLCMVPQSVISDFLGSAHQVGAASTAHQSSLFHLVSARLGGSDLAGFIAGITCVLAATAMAWFGMRGVDDDTLWAVGFVAALVVTPVVWWHYEWVCFGALAIVLGAQRRLDDRWMMLLPLAALATLPPSNPAAAHKGTMPLYQTGYLVATAFVTVALAARTRGGSARGAAS